MNNQKHKLGQGFIDGMNDWMENRDQEKQAQFVAWVMKEEGVDQQTAIRMCCNGTDEEIPKYTLGYKLTPTLLIDLYLLPSKKTRQKVKMNFMLQLTPEEQDLFIQNFDSIGKLFKSRMKSESKKRE